MHTGTQSSLNAMKTSSSFWRRIKQGWWIDHLPGQAPRATATDPAVSQYYRDYQPHRSQDGSKVGAAVVPASLYDAPSSTFDARYSFETVAQAVDTGHVYGTVRWGFTVSDARTRTVTGEYSHAHASPARTTLKALAEFDKHYRNPGSSTAPAPAPAPAVVPVPVAPLPVAVP